MKVKTYSEKKIARIQKMVEDCENIDKWLEMRITRLARELAKVTKKRIQNRNAKAKYDLAFEAAQKRHLADDAKRI